VNRTCRVTVSILSVLVLLLLFVSYRQYRAEQCFADVTGPAGGEILRVCYSRGSWHPEDFRVYAELYGNDGALLRRELVGGEDIQYDIMRRFSCVKWDPSVQAFVDNTGQPIMKVTAPSQGQ
jgi:hypothetical protein